MGGPLSDEVKPVKKTVLLLGVFALVVAACSASDTVVATVDGRPITLENVEELFASDGGAVDKVQFARELRNAIVETILIDTAKSEFGIEIDPSEIETRYQELVAQVESTGTSYDDFLAEQGITDTRVRRIAHQFLIQDAVIEALVERAGAITEEQIQERFDQQLTQRTEACVSHILTETEEEAEAVRQRLEAGEDFATVAREVSIDPSAADNGGDLGCGPLGQYVPEFAVGALRAPIGTPTTPVRSQFGYHVILVESRTEPVLDDSVREEIVAQLEAERRGSLFQEWLLETVAAADVTVEEEYGEWVTSPVPDVAPPQ